MLEGVATNCESLLRGSRALPTPPFRLKRPTRIVVPEHAFASKISTTESKLSPTTEMMVDRLHRRGGNMRERRQRRLSRGPQRPSAIDCSAYQRRVILFLYVTNLAEGGEVTSYAYRIEHPRSRRVATRHASPRGWPRWSSQCNCLGAASRSWKHKSGSSSFTRVRSNSTCNAAAAACVRCRAPSSR